MAGSHGSTGLEAAALERDHAQADAQSLASIGEKTRLRGHPNAGTQREGSGDRLGRQEVQSSAGVETTHDRNEPAHLQQSDLRWQRIEVALDSPLGLRFQRLDRRRQGAAEARVMGARARR